MSIVYQEVDRVDVIIGAAVVGRVARLAMIGSPASGGQVLDQYALDLADDAKTDLVDTIVGTYRAVAVAGHRVAATRLCLPDSVAADSLRQTALSAGVQNVEVVAEADAAGALARSVGADAVLLLANDDTVSLTMVGEDAESGSELASGPIGAAGAAAACAAVLQQVPSAAATRIMLVGQRLDLDSIAAEVRSTAPVEVPPDAGYAIARGAAQTAAADDSEFPAGVAALKVQTADHAAIGPELAYSQEEPDVYEMPADSIDEFIPEHDDDAPYTALIALPPPRTLPMASALTFTAMAIGTLAVTVAVAIRPETPVEAQQAPTVQSDTVRGRYLPSVPHEPDPAALPLAVPSPPPVAPQAAPSVATNRGLANNAPSAPAPQAPALPPRVPPGSAPPAQPAPKGPPPPPPTPALQVPVVPIPPIIILPPLNPFPLPTFPTPSTTVTTPTTTTTAPTTTTSTPTPTPTPTTMIPTATSPPPTTSSEPSTIPSSPSAIVTSTPEPNPSAAQEPAYTPAPVYTPSPAPDNTHPAFAPEPTSGLGIEAPAPAVQAPAPAVEEPSSSSDSSSGAGSSASSGSDSSSGSGGSAQEPVTVTTESP